MRRATIGWDSAALYPKIRRHRESSIFKSLEHRQLVNSAGAWHFDYLYIRGIFEPHGAGQIRRGIPTKFTTKCNNLWFKICHNEPLSQNLLDQLQSNGRNNSIAAA